MGLPPRGGIGLRRHSGRCYALACPPHEYENDGIDSRLTRDGPVGARYTLSMRRRRMRWPEIGATLALFLPIIGTIAWIIVPTLLWASRDWGCACSAPMDWAEDQCQFIRHTYLLPQVTFVAATCLAEQRFTFRPWVKFAATAGAALYVFSLLFPFVAMLSINGIERFRQ